MGLGIYYVGPVGR